MFQQIQVPASSVPAGAEFGIYVSGDSMEPRYHNGQIVWVKRCEELECGDIGIFVYDDCGYLKKYDEHTPDKSQAEFLTDSYGVVHNQPVLVSLNTKIFADPYISRAKIRGCWKSFELKRWEEFLWIRSSVFRI